MMTPTDVMRSWIHDEVEGWEREPAGTETPTATTGTPGGGAEEKAEEENNTITPLEAFNAVSVEGEGLLDDMHSAAMVFPNTFDKFLNNMDMNRIPSLYCFDHTRVVLSETHGTGDYYHASFVDGYNKKSAYIFAQAPFDDNTERAFWRMVVDQKPSMILVFGNVDEKQNKRKTPFDISTPGFEKAVYQEFGAKSMEECELKAKLCRQFWPSKNATKKYDKIKIEGTDENAETHMKTFSFDIKDGDEEEGKPGILMHFHEWGEKMDDELPEYMLDMRASIKVQYIRSSKKPGAPTGPVILVCATGVAKCSIYATVDIVVSRMTEEHNVGFKETMSAMKSQRFGCFQTTAPYMTAREMLMKFAVSTGVVHDAAIGDKPKSRRNKAPAKEGKFKKAVKGGFLRKK